MRLPIFGYVILSLIFSVYIYAQHDNSLDEPPGFIYPRQVSNSQIINDYNKANLLFYQQKYKDAIKLYEDIIENSNEIQIIETIKMRMGETYEKLGNYDSAVKIYESLLEKKPDDYRIKSSIANLYRWQKKYDKALSLFKEIMPENDSYYELAGLIYLEAGEYDSALITLKKIIEYSPNDMNSYRRLAYIFYQNGMVNDGIEIYQKARIFFNDPNLFAFELAELYEFQMEYKKACDEYLSLLNKKMNQFENIQEKIIGLIIKDKSIYQYSVDKINKILENNSEGKDDNFRFLLVSLLLKNSSVGKAVNEYEKIINKNIDKKNILLLSFSEDLEKMGYKEEAIEIYKKIEPNKISFSLAQSKIIELLFLTGRYQESIEKAESFIATNPRTDYLETSMYFMAESYFNLRKFSIARRIMVKIIEANQHSNFYKHCLIKIADTYFAEGNFDQALKDFDNILNIDFFQSIHDYAYYMKAECYIMNNRYDEGLKLLNNFIGKYKDSLYVNDVLEETNFLTGSMENSDAVKIFLKSRTFKMQGREQDAINELENIIKVYPLTAVFFYAYFEIGKIYINLNRFDDALAIYQALQTKNPESVLASFAQEKIAYIYAEKIKDNNKAIESYQKIIINYPGSILVSNARENIRKLRIHEIYNKEP